jgi:hypothetical protein
MDNVRIEKIPLYNVLEFPKKYNNNNNWENGVIPNDYVNKISKTYTHNWINQFHDNYKIITFFKNDIEWMWDAFLIGRFTGELSRLYIDEYNDMVNKHGSNDIFNGTKYFVRTECASLKYGKYGTGPYININEIIISMITSTNFHKTFYKHDSSCNIYLLPWIENFDEK